MIQDAARAAFVAFVGLFLHAASSPNSPTPTPPVAVITPPAGSDALASLPVDTKATTTAVVKDDVYETAVASESEMAKHYFVPSVDTATLCHVCGENIYQPIHLWKNVSAHAAESSAEVRELRERVAELEAEVARLSEPKFTAPAAKPQPVKSVPVYYRAPQSCSGPGCNQRRGFFGRRR